MDRVTRYGFIWGPVEVTRLVEHEGRVGLEVKTQSHRVYVDGLEWGPK